MVKVGPLPALSLSYRAFHVGIIDIVHQLGKSGGQLVFWRDSAIAIVCPGILDDFTHRRHNLFQCLKILLNPSTHSEGPIFLVRFRPDN